jgi:flagellar basal-body rod protein FlgB
MAMSFDKALGIHTQTLDLRSRRAEVIAANLANQDTPNYLARDMDFKTVLASVQGNGLLKLTQLGHLQPCGHSPGELLYRVPTQPAIDGNTVDEQQEKAAFSDNALRYQASLRLLSNRIQSLLSAIRGE